jgi:hypothetical protein
LVITKQGLLATVAERWRLTYHRRDEWFPTEEGRWAQQIHGSLQALPPTASEAEVVAVLGNNWLTQNVCDECGEDREVTVVLGDESHHATDGARVCLDCLQAALRLAGQI